MSARIGVFGATGYTGREVVRLLQHLALGELSYDQDVGAMFLFRTVEAYLCIDYGSLRIDYGTQLICCINFNLLKIRGSLIERCLRFVQRGLELRK